MRAEQREKYLLDANEKLLKSKGYIIFVINQDGDLESMGDTIDCNPAEHRGLIHYAMDTLSTGLMEENVDPNQ